MVVVERVYRESELPDACRLYARDTVTLGWEDRTHVHVRAGDCFVIDDARVIATVVERPEPVFLVEPRSAPEWALFAYHIGNRHQPMMITDRALVCPDVPGVEQLLQQHRMPYTRSMQPFTPAATIAAHHH
ncbi:MAG: hypothetical protein AUJ01_07675 [Acidobacteria bacterium 13_1_40CM_3_65_5]|nr:MAG: hypothetical protein AUJ01_07675 [Acidobacteria bacterium 13_1_40CM_3_65_5]